MTPVQYLNLAGYTFKPDGRQGWHTIAMTTYSIHLIEGWRHWTIGLQRENRSLHTVCSPEYDNEHLLVHLLAAVQRIVDADGDFYFHNIVLTDPAPRQL